MFRGRDRMDLDATVTVTGKALTVAVTVPALFLGGGLFAVLLMQAVGGAGALLMAVLLARKIRLKAERPGRAILQELANGGGPIAVFFDSNRRCSRSLTSSFCPSWFPRRSWAGTALLGTSWGCSSPPP